MLCVKAKVGTSPIQGLGLIAKELIRKDQVVWVFQEGFDLTFKAKDLDKLSTEAKEQVIHYSYRCSDTGLYVYCGDDARFMNHSDDSNTYSRGEGLQGETLATRDIAPGEELTTDYYEYDLDSDLKLARSKCSRVKLSSE